MPEIRSGYKGRVTFVSGVQSITVWEVISSKTGRVGRDRGNIPGKLSGRIREIQQFTYVSLRDVNIDSKSLKLNGLSNEGFELLANYF